MVQNAVHQVVLPATGTHLQSPKVSVRMDWPKANPKREIHFTCSFFLNRQLI